MSKKRGKINKQVKKIFNGLGFDQGIEKLNDDLLIELLLFVGIKPKSFQRHELLKSIRAFWCETGINIRKAILNFITSRLGQNDLDNDYEQRVEKIEEVARNFTQDKNEINLLIDGLKDLKSKKITEKKIKNKLTHLRFLQMQQDLYEQTMVKVDVEGEGYFTYSYTFHLFNETFHKEMKTQITKIKDFASLSFKDKVFNLLRAKENAFAKQQKQITQTLQNLPQNHLYLTQNDTLFIVKSMHYDDSLQNPHIPLTVLRKVFYEFVVIEEQEYIALQKPMQCQIFSQNVTYNLIIKFEKKSLYRDIFYSEKLNIQEIFKQKNLENISHLQLKIDSLKDEMKKFSSEIDVDDKTIEKYIQNHLIKDIQNSKVLQIRHKIVKRVMYHYQEHIVVQKRKLYKQRLLKQTVRDFKNLFPVARNLKRKLIFHMGPTNSGKTYTAMQKLKNANSGYYLAPLRLLALEGYEDMKNSALDCSLITGEEEMINEESTHVSSTIEMLNFGFDIDCCVIDEVQMLNDKDRGWAWINAIIGAPAKTLYMTGSKNALPALQEIATWLDEELEIVEFERKNPLKLLPKPIALEDIEPQTAIIAFSRKDVLSLKQRLWKKYSVSVVYGNLSPEVRREEARRFREGESQILVATDAIAMGLNLPIKTILFSKETKFDGEVRRELNSDEVTQIAGRAGRYGIEEIGYVGGINQKIQNVIGSKLEGALKVIKSPFTVMANLDHIRLVSEILETNKLYDILDFFANNMQFDGPFVAKRLEQMMEIAHITDSYELELEMKYHLSCAPVSINSPYIETKFHEYILNLEKNQKVIYTPIKHLPSHANSAAMLLKIEDRVKEISLYLWLSFKFPTLFSDTQKALRTRAKLNQFIENSLKFSQFIKRCKRCGAALDFDFKYKVCDRCFHKNKQRF